MTTKIKKTGKVLGVIIGLLLLTTQCCRYSEIDFLTPNRFDLDVSAHTFEIAIKQSAIITNLIINGTEVGISRQVLINQDIVTVDYEGYSIVYETFSREGIRQWRVIEIIGEWFTIAVAEDDRSMHVSIDENSDNIERTLGMRLYGDGKHGARKNIHYWGEINIIQRKE
jgi:hypothetical protein